MYSVNVQIIQNKLCREKSAEQKKMIESDLKSTNTQHIIIRLKPQTF